LVVWRRFSEFKKLHKDLSKIYHKQAHSKPFPSLPKATFFGKTLMNNHTVHKKATVWGVLTIGDLLAYIDLKVGKHYDFAAIKKIAAF